MLGVSATQIGNNNNTHHTSSVRGADGGAMVAASAEAQESGGTSGGSCGDVGGATPPSGIFMSEEAEKSGGGGGGGNRWPRQETLALLKIRSDMDLSFRDSSLKGPLWDEVSRKMGELGYHRNAKKCKEKFENVYKYHKRTKEGRSSKADGKTYRFFDQLQALENIGGGPPSQPPPPPASVQLPPQPRPASLQKMAGAVTKAVPIQVVQPTKNNPSPHQHQLTVSSTPQNTTISFNNPFTSSFPQPSQPPHMPPQQQTTVVAGNNAVVPPSFLSNSLSSSSSTSSDEETEKRHDRKRKFKELFQSLMQNVVEKQDALQKKFLETLEKRERDRVMREEAWRVEEMARLKNEHDLLVQERSMAAERESALISLLQRITEHQQTPNNTNNPNAAISFGTDKLPEKPVTPTPTPTPPPQTIVHQSPPPPSRPQVREPSITTSLVMAPQFIRPMENSPRQENNNNNNNSGGLEIYNTSSPTSSRWPKAEIDALINLRTHLDNKYQENGPKGPLWEEISGEMKKLGYNRNAKRCKEKWENINKYYKKVKESNKRRPEDSKTCPYFHQLDALYREKEKSVKPENSMIPIMATPEQQWPFAQQQEPPLQAQAVQVPPQQEHAMEEQEGENNEDEYDDEDDECEDDEENEGRAYEIVTHKQPSSVTSTT